MLSPELHRCCLGERAGGAKHCRDPPKIWGLEDTHKKHHKKRKFKLFGWRKNAERLLPPLRSRLRGFWSRGVKRSGRAGAPTFPPPLAFLGVGNSVLG